MGSKYTDADVAEAIVVLQRFRAAPGVSLSDAEAHALTVIYDRYVTFDGAVAVAVGRVLRARADREDAIQRVFERLPWAIRRFRAGRFEGWIGTVARNVARDVQRTQRRRREAPLDGVREPDVSDGDRGNDRAFDLEDLAAAERCIAQLPVRQRALIEMTRAGCARRDIAERLGITINNANVLYSRACGRLRECVRRDRPREA